MKAGSTVENQPEEKRQLGKEDIYDFAISVNQTKLFS